MVEDLQLETVVAARSTFSPVGSRGEKGETTNAGCPQPHLIRPFTHIWLHVYTYEVSPHFDTYIQEGLHRGGMTPAMAPRVPVITEDVRV